MTRRHSWMPRFLPMATPIALLLATLAATPAAAADREIYVGFHLGLAGIDINRTDAFDQVLDGDENSLSYDIGYKFNDFLAVEVGYYDLSKVDGGDPTLRGRRFVLRYRDPGQDHRLLRRDRSPLRHHGAHPGIRKTRHRVLGRQRGGCDRRTRSHPGGRGR